jgi:succinate dehydrogenase / fumarate reductase iron-sulfur subunit
MSASTIKVEIKRQSTPDAPATTEKFEVPYRPNMNITSLLGEIALNPVDVAGKATTPITYDSNCLEEICGSCAMLVNGRARMACSALIDNLEQPVKLEPFSKFPVVRDLAVDRSVLFENLKAVKAWFPIDGSYDLGSGPRITQEEQEQAYPLSNCISCCCCMEACPQFNEDTGFVGAATIAQVSLFNTHPTGKALQRERLAALMGDGGVQECGYAQNCVEICPKEIPLTNAISKVSGDVMKQAIGDMFRR